MMSRPITWTISPPSGARRSRPPSTRSPSRRRRRRRARCTASSRRYTRSGRRPRRITRGPAGFRRGSRSPVHVAGDTPVLEPLLDPLAGWFRAFEVPSSRSRKPERYSENAETSKNWWVRSRYSAGLPVIVDSGSSTSPGSRWRWHPSSHSSPRACTAVRAGSLDVPVREELVVDGVVRDHDLLLVEMTALVEVTDELLGHPPCSSRRGCGRSCRTRR